ncbi:MAG TPA: hypothetical protein DHW82_08645 [Spirochaetia bacterium]|nr:MAG: hypothetical protein A2Y41_05005 [Spirochaetes bacterium GWB1_36_13]HCL57058.1 hypothetical protein [Spirochaetia bacterium]
MIRFFVFFFLFFPVFLKADILIKVGVFKMEKVAEEYLKAKELRESWNLFLDKKYYQLSIYQKEYDFIKNMNGPLSERINLNNKLLSLKKKIAVLEEKKRKDFLELETLKGKELKKEIILAIKEARRKKGFSLIFPEEDFILFYDEKVDFNTFLLEELTAREEERLKQNTND